jgi:protein tyrosine phosphatase
MMSVDKDQKKLLIEMIELILLNEKELEILKVLINELSAGKIDAKQLKMAIIKSRATALKRIIDIFPFFHKRIINQQEIDKFAGNINPEVIQELEEKDKFLEEIGVRINKIVNNLSN